jgi:hypothetical protein
MGRGHFCDLGGLKRRDRDEPDVVDGGLRDFENAVGVST